jgi:hypothetical protein
MALASDVSPRPILEVGEACRREFVELDTVIGRIMPERLP